MNIENQCWWWLRWKQSLSFYFLPSLHSKPQLWGVSLHSRWNAHLVKSPWETCERQRKHFKVHSTNPQSSVHLSKWSSQICCCWCRPDSLRPPFGSPTVSMQPNAQLNSCQSWLVVKQKEASEKEKRCYCCSSGSFSNIWKSPLLLLCLPMGQLAAFSSCFCLN